MKKIFYSLFLCLIMTFFLSCPDTHAADINNIGNPSYTLKSTMDNSDTFVYLYNVMDYGAHNDGVTDNTDIFQKLLNKAGSLGGGTIYVPSGKYVVRGTLTIPKGVILRGDWQVPDKSKALPDGTLLMAYTGRNGNERTSPFIEMAPETGLMDVAIWYPEQDASNIVPYSPTIRYGLNNYFGNEYSNTRNVTLVNSYIGILFNYDNGGASPVIYNLYGTTLCKGIEIDNIADVGRIDGVHFSPDYWINSGLGNASSNSTSLKNYMKNNSTGIVMRRNDWSYTCNINIDGYLSGYNAEYSLSPEKFTPNGHHYNFNITDCKTAIAINATNSVGILFDTININRCENGVTVADNTSDVVQFQNAVIAATKYAIRTSASSNTKFILNQSTINNGQVSINGGTLTSNGCKYNNKAPQLYFGLSGRGIIKGCTFKENRSISNNSIYEISVDDNASYDSLEKYPEITYDFHKPSRTVMYNALDFGASTNAYDNTTAIQNALNKASTDGGGIVFIPSGKYKVRGHLTVPGNVELRGAVDIQTVPHGSGTILEAYENRNNPDGACFINLKANAGLRGIVVDYPEQIFTGSESWAPAKYPYTIQGQGDNVYIINTGVRAAYKALDLFTYKCNNHYVDFLGGHTFDVGVKVGNNCENGKIYNLMFNVIVYACGNESKFGSFSNMPNGVSNAPLYNYGLANLDFLILGDCKNETLYNDFHYGSYRGLLLINEGNGGPSGTSMGMGIDGSRRSIYVGSDTTGTFNLYNSQVVALGNDTTETTYFYLDKNAKEKLNVYNSDYWGQPYHGIVSDNNSINFSLIGANFQNPGQSTFAALNGSDTNIIGSNMNQNGTGFVDNGSEKYMSISGSTVNNRNNATESFKKWSTNQNTYATLSSTGALSKLDRTKWNVSASNNTNNARNAIDGNINTRWDTAGFQTPGQWFTVDFGSAYKFNTLILDIGSSTADAPASYSIYVSDDGNNWGAAIASGNSSSGIIQFNEQNKRYVRIVQTGTKSGNYWSIHELYALSSGNNNDLPNGEVPITDDTPSTPDKPDSTLYAGNPIITSIFTADPSAHVWNDGRIYVYASHDMDPARGCDLMDRYHVFSSDNMVDWVDEGEILSSDDVSWGRPEGGFMWAPDCAYKNGTYYFYYPHPSDTNWNDSWKIGVATSKSPAKDYKDTGKYIEGLSGYALIDPCVFTDDDGTSYIYIGGGNKAVGAKLADDMVSIEGDVKEMTGLEDFHEAAWVFKRNGIYYMMYADNLNGANRLRYATSNSPLGPWEYKGIVLDSVDSYTSHGSIVEFKGEWYLFYHNQAISGQGELRSVCADKLTFNADGTINTVVQTKTGVPMVGEKDSESQYATKYLPKDATLNLAEVFDNSSAFGGQNIGNMHLDDSSFTFTNVDGGTKGGRANILVHYAALDSLAKLKLTVNGKDYSTINLLGTGDWNTYNGTANLTVDFVPGKNNTVTFTHSTGGVNVDYVQVTLLDEGTTEDVTNSTKYSVENAVVANDAIIVDDANAYKGKSIGNMHLDNAYFTLSNLNGGSKGGKADLIIHYATNDDAASVKVSMNDNDLGTISLASTKGWNTYNDSNKISVSLNPGSNNTIKITHNSGGVNIDYIEVILHNDAPSIEPVKTSDKISIEGYQISHTLKGLRVVSSVSNTIDGKKVVKFGNIYGLGLTSDNADSELVLDSDNKYVYNYESTKQGILGSFNGALPDTTYYAMTMINNGTTVAAYTAKYYVRSYAVLEDGSVVYSKYSTYTIYDVAKHLYDNVMMPNFSAHKYLYDDILTVVTPDYKEVKYNYNNGLVTP